ncbi:hypothetical protein Tco_0368880 [Tanacetum coccineum]
MFRERTRHGEMGCCRCMVTSGWGGRLDTLRRRTMGGNDDEAGSSRSKRSSQYKTVEEVLLPQVHHEFLLWEGCNKEAKSRAFNIKEPIYSELCHMFYSTYEFDEVCANDELQTKKIIKFRLGGRAHSFTLLEFAHRLGLYHAEELDEEGFDVYFQGGLRSDEYFNAQEYWLSISREENLSFTPKRVRKCGLVARWMKRKGVGTQRESQICCRQFITQIARKARVLSDVVIRSLSAPIYCRDLDTITLRELIDSKGRLIPEDPQPGVPRVAIPRPPRASMQDLYDRMGSMEIRQEAIERMEYRQSYHWDMYAEVFEHMAGVYSVPLQGAYNPPGYAQPQYDQY